jgi:hypothetical protein
MPPLYDAFVRQSARREAEYPGKLQRTIGEWPPLGTTLKQYRLEYGEVSLADVKAYNEFLNAKELYLGQSYGWTTLKGIQTGQRNIFALDARLVATKYGWERPPKNKSCSFNFESAFYSIVSDLKVQVRRYSHEDVRAPLITEFDNWQATWRRGNNIRIPPAPPPMTHYDYLTDRLIAFTLGFEVVLDKFRHPWPEYCSTQLTIRLVGYGAP